MPHMNQTIIEVAAPDGGRGLGRRGETTLIAMYPGSPIYAGGGDPYVGSDDEVKELAQALLPADDITEAQAYYSFDAAFSRDFDDSPNIPAGVLTTNGAKAIGGGEGAPATAYVPNTTSPGPGSTSALDQPPLPAGTVYPTSTSFPNAGGGHDTNPSSTSANIAAQNDGAMTIGQYGLGSSGAAGPPAA